MLVTTSTAFRPKEGEDVSTTSTALRPKVLHDVMMLCYDVML